MGRITKNLRQTLRNLAIAVFGDRVGLILFLGSLVFFWLTWRIDFFITDNLTLANTLANISDGHLYLTEIPYAQGSTSAATPGTQIVDGRLYGRNYGQLFLALPFLWLLDSIASVADPAIALVGTWSLLLLALFRQVGVEVGRREQFTFLGAAVALATFVLNVQLARPIDSHWFALMALQLSTMIAGAFIPVVSYRLLRAIHDKQTGVSAGAGIALATPVAIWATVPKRHTFTALLALLSVYTFYRSRAATSKRTAIRFRALSYTFVGLTAWIHGPEGALLLVALAFVDVLTARSHDFRGLAVLGVVFLVALIPLFVTNLLVSGDPLAVPRMLTAYDGVETVVGIDVQEPGSGSSVEESAGDSSAGSAGGPSGFPSGPMGFFSYPIGVAHTVFGIGDVFLAQIHLGIESVGNPEFLLRAFIRRGNPEYRVGQSPNNLAVLESMPVAAVLISTPFVVYRQLRVRLDRSTLGARISPERAVDLFVTSYLFLLVFIYAPRIPVHASITVRYLHPMYPLFIYLVARLSVVRAVPGCEWRLLVWSYIATVLVGGQLLVLFLFQYVSTPGAAIQAHGLLALAAAGLLIVWSLLATIRGGYERTGAVLIGATAGVSTLFVVLSAHVYFGSMSRQAVPFMRVFAESLSLL